MDFTVAKDGECINSLILKRTYVLWLEIAGENEKVNNQSITILSLSFVSTDIKRGRCEYIVSLGKRETQRTYVD